MKKQRKKRSRSDLEKELRDQLSILLHACESYDNGLKPIGKHIALSLRVLLHNHRQSQALLQQLRFLDRRFFDTAGELNPNNLLSDCNLCVLRASGSGADYEPLFTSGGGPIPPRWVRFPDWWSMPVVKDQQGQKFSRSDIILNVADTDGGAHVDPELDEAYMALSRENSLGWVFTHANIESQLEGPELPCIRQIACEVIETIKKKAPEYFKF